MGDSGERQYAEGQERTEVEKDSHADDPVDPGDGQQEAQRGHDREGDEGHVFSG